MFGSCSLASTSVHLHCGAEGSAKPLFLVLLNTWWSGRRLKLAMDEQACVCMCVLCVYVCVCVSWLENIISIEQ